MANNGNNNGFGPGNGNGNGNGAIAGNGGGPVMIIREGGYGGYPGYGYPPIVQPKERDEKVPPRATMAKEFIAQTEEVPPVRIQAALAYLSMVHRHTGKIVTQPTVPMYVVGGGGDGGIKSEPGAPPVLESKVFEGNKLDALEETAVEAAAVALANYFAMKDIPQENKDAGKALGDFLNGNLKPNEWELKSMEAQPTMELTCFACTQKGAIDPSCPMCGGTGKMEIIPKGINKQNVGKPADPTPAAPARATARTPR